MASGRLGTPSDLAATTNTTLYTVPTDTFSVVSVSLCNRSNNPVSVRLAASTLDNPTDAEWLEYDTELGGHGVLERTGIIIETGEKIVVRASAAGVSAVVFGIETSTT